MNLEGMAVYLNMGSIIYWVQTTWLEEDYQSQSIYAGYGVAVSDSNAFTRDSGAGSFGFGGMSILLMHAYLAPDISTGLDMALHIVFKHYPKTLYERAEEIWGRSGP